MDDELHTTAFYDLHRIFNQAWLTTALAWLRDSPRRPRDLDEIVDGWRFLDRWRDTSRGLTHARVHEALTTLAHLGLVEKHEFGSGFEREAEYRLTEAGKAYLVELDRQREWLRRHPAVLDNAVRHFRARHPVLRQEPGRS